MNAITVIVLAIVIAALVTLLVPGGVLVAPIVLAAAAIWLAVRVIGSRREGSSAGPR
jgi:hypothetical protein